MRKLEFNLSGVGNLNLQQKLKQVQQRGSALLAANFYNLETLRGILEAAAENKSPIIVQVSKGSIEYMGLSVAASMTRSALTEYGIEGWLHLDHATSIDLIQRCLDAGFDSVMIDASEKSIVENIKITRAVVKKAELYRANVEAELGYIAKLGQSTVRTGFTDPEEARGFVAETGVHALAVAIGSAHGFYKQKPQLELDLLSRIRSMTDVCLVLHGASGIPDIDLKEAIRRGICKINIATETKNIFMTTLKEEITHTSEIDLRQVFPPAIRAVKELIKQKFHLINE